MMAVYAMWPCSGVVLSWPGVRLSPSEIPQGDPALIRVELKQGETPHVWWMEREVYLVRGGQTRWYGVLGVDLKTKPGTYPLVVKVSPGPAETKLDVTVVAKDRGVRRLTLPKAMVDLDEPTLERVRMESAVMDKVLAAPATPPAWRGPFRRPVEGSVVGPFGQGSVINEAPRSPHSGVDLKGERGTPVVAMNHGRVVLVADHFFSGRSVVIDHGGAVQSMYFHLDKVLVQEGDVVATGDVIGLLGATGRATGPHLHLGVRVNGARVDPLALVSISENME